MQNPKTCLIVVFVATFLGCSGNPEIETTQPQTVERPSEQLSETDAKIFATNVSEDLILELTPKLKLISSSLLGGKVDLSTFMGECAFNPSLDDLVLAQAIEGAVSNSDSQLPGLPHSLDWPTNNKLTSELWKPIRRDANVTFDDASFGIVSGRMSPDSNHFVMETSFEGRFNDTKERVVGTKAKQTLIWKQNETGQWNIVEWKQDSFHLSIVNRTLFQDVTNLVVPDSKTQLTLSRSIHSEMLVERMQPNTNVRIENPLRRQMPDWESSFQFTSASVVDHNQDGWDDVLILDRHADPVFLQNNQDGTFKDVSDDVGLAGKNITGNCSLFFDFDNDGDRDLFIGRAFDPCLFFRCEEGKFVEDKTVNQLLAEISFVTSASACDINRDGLLDLYLCTYSAGGLQPQEFAKHVVGEEDRLKLELLIKRNNAFIDRGGPPNIILLNDGNQFSRPKLDDTAKQWRHTFSSVWSDIDGDGDQDLYVCNDFSPDAFLRNETEANSAEVKFTDMTSDLIGDGTTGFGMGASFGDFNSDGSLDLYVSNMYSKAGNRVFKELGSDFDPKILLSAQGNFLYQRDGEKFRQVAGLNDSQQHVSKVGWSFGGQFADFNNDGNLDLYVPSGYYSAPQSVDTQVDL